MKRAIQAILALALILTSACATRAIHPGAVNTFDSHAYDTLLQIQAALEQASKEVVNYPHLKPELNKVIDGYNAAQAAYKKYHEDALAGWETNQTGLDALIKQVSAAVKVIAAKLKPSAVREGPFFATGTIEVGPVGTVQ